MKLELHQFSSGMGVPNPSPFCMKLEGFMRLTGLEYKVVIQNDPRKAPKGKLPYIVHGKQKIGDSSLVIDYLKQQFDIDPDAHLAVEEKAIHHALRVMLDERLYFVLMYNRWAIDENWDVLKDRLFGAIPKLLRGVITNKIRSNVLNDLKSQGIKRHTSEEIYQMGVQDVNAISVYLDDKQWFGGEAPCTLDVCAVSYLANFLIPPIDSPVKRAIQDNQQLVDYTERAMKRIFDQ